MNHGKHRARRFDVDPAARPGKIPDVNCRDMINRMLLVGWTAVLCALPVGAAADVLLLYPPGMPTSHAEALAASLRSSIGLKVVAAAEKPAPSVASSSPPQVVIEQIASGEAAYKKLNLSEVPVLLDGIEGTCARLASVASCRDIFFEAAMLRAMALSAAGEPDEAEREYQNAHIAYPSRIPEPKRYSPNVLRAFAAACADLDAQPGIRLRIRELPAGSAIFVDGERLKNDEVKVPPGRHVLFARCAGFDDAVRVLDLREDSDVPMPLAPLNDPDAWEALLSHASRLRNTAADRALLPLLQRFDIDAVLLARYNSTGDAIQFRLMADGKWNSSAFVPLPVGETTVSSELSAALRAALGPPPQDGPITPAVSARVSAQTAPSAGEEEDDDGSVISEEDEDENPAIQYQSGNETPTASKKKNIFKSPWFWISIAATAAIVSGVAVGVQLDR